MSALLKGPVATLAARPLGAKSATMFEVVAPTPEAVEIKALRAECGRLTDALAAVPVQMKSAVAQANEDGRAQGQAAARADEEGKLELTRDALTGALFDWQARLAGLDQFAARIAGAAVEKIFGEWEQGAELVTRAARERLDRLRHEAVLALRVSAKDFTDAALVEAAATQLDRPCSQLIVDPRLGPGECRIDLTLGHIDIGPRSQIAALVALLDAPDADRSA